MVGGERLRRGSRRPTRGDEYPPLYYLLLKAWVWLAGDSLAAMRALSVLCSVLALYLLFRLIEGAMPRVVCYAVILWCALSPYDLYFAQEAGIYAPASAAVLGACLAYRRWIESGTTRRSALVLYAIYRDEAVVPRLLHRSCYRRDLAALPDHRRARRNQTTVHAWKAWIVASTRGWRSPRALDPPLRAHPRRGDATRDEGRDGLRAAELSSDRCSATTHRRRPRCMARVMAGARGRGCCPFA